MKQASMSVVALVRSLRADHLSEADLEKLSSAASARAAVAQLSASRAYKDFVSASAAPVGIGQELQSRLWADMKKIRRYQNAAGSDFIDYFIYRTDVGGLSGAIAALHAGTSDHALSFRAAYAELSRLDLMKTASARPPAELMDSARGTRYEKILADVLTAYIGTGDLISAETALTRAADVRFLEVSGGMKGKTGEPSASFRKTGLFRLRACESDLALIKDFARLSRFDVPENAKLALSRPVMTALPAGRLAALAALDDPGGLAGILAGTDYSRLDTARLEDSADKYLADLLNKTLIYSLDPDELVFAYVLSRTAEIRRLTGIIRQKAGETVD